MKKIDAVLILPDIRSTYNVGAIFRTADAVGISKIYLVGITPAPLDRFGKVRSDIAKSALGAEQTVNTIIAIEQSERAVDYKKVRLSGPTAFILGNEVTGISQSVLAKCDVIAEIPMHGMKESLNVSVATGIALFRMLGR